MTDLLPLLQSALAGRYDVEGELGHGGMATVFLARDLKHPRKVAIKVFRPDWSTPTGVERFLREIDITSRLQHPHILPLLDSGVLPGEAGDPAGRPYYVMPYVEGESLRGRLRRGRTLPVDEAVRITRAVAAALDYAHSQGVVHRDIKPENILISHGEPMVADFGIARALESSVVSATPADQSTLTKVGTVIGTVAYMSPEQSSGEKVDGRSDVYSLGCVLFELLVGRPPYTGATPHEVIARRFTDPLPRVRRERPEVPESIARALTRALAVLPEQRFPSAAAFAGALGAEGPAVARRPTRQFLLMLAGSAALAVAWLGGSVLLRKIRATKYDANLVAVAPFDVLGSKHAVWHEGLVDILSANLDGAGPLRTSAPSVIVRRWKGRADPASARELGRGLKAGLVVYGRLMDAGGDSVRLTASVMDLIANKNASEVEVRGPEDRMDQLVDSLTLRLLRDLGRSRAVGAVRSASLGSGSLAALRAYLQGEQYYRRGAWDSAESSYRRAVELDSMFAVAYYHLARAQTWINQRTDTSFVALFRRAGTLNHRLPPRDSLLIAAEGIGALLTDTDSAYHHNQRRRFTTLEQATQRYADDPDVWYALGEARYHEGFLVAVSPREVLEPFARAVALDPQFVPGYQHLLPLSLLLRGADTAIRYTETMISGLPEKDLADAARIVRKILGSPGRAAQLSDNLPKDASPTALFEAGLILQSWPDSAEAAVHLLELMRERWLAAQQTGQVYGFDPEQTIWSLRAARGHLADLRAAADPEDYQVYAWLAKLGVVAEDSALATFERWLQGEQVRRLVGALPFWAQRGDTAAILRFRAVVERQRASDLYVRKQYLLDAAGAYLSLARRDTAAALGRFLAIPDSLCATCGFPMVTRVELLTAVGRGQDALPTLLKAYDLTMPWPTPMSVYWLFVRARALEQAGHRTAATRWYRYVEMMWRNPDPELRSWAEEARTKAEALNVQR